MTIKTSRRRSLLVAAVAACAVRALAVCELPVPVFVVATFAVVAIAVHDMLRTRISRLTRDDDGQWHARSPDGERCIGQLAEAGYRSAGLLVLVFDEDTSGPEFHGRPALRPSARRRRRVPIFVDSVDARDFSFLHLSLAFGRHAA